MRTCVAFGIKRFAPPPRARCGKVHRTVDLDIAGHAGHADIDIDTTSISSGIAEFDQHHTAC